MTRYRDDIDRGTVKTVESTGLVAGAAKSLADRMDRRRLLTAVQIAALVHLTEQRRISNSDMQELAPDVSAETLRRDLADLQDRVARQEAEAAQIEAHEGGHPEGGVADRGARGGADELAAGALRAVGRGGAERRSTCRC